MPMQPSPCAETLRPSVPSARCSMTVSLVHHSRGPAATLHQRRSTVPEGPHGMPRPRVSSPVRLPPSPARLPSSPARLPSSPARLPSSPVRLPPFQTLLDTHGRDVHRFLIASIGAVDADDCYQETWLAALRAYPGLQDPSNLRGWIFTIAHRKVIDHVRARARRPTPVHGVGEAIAAAPVTTAADGDG